LATRSRAWRPRRAAPPGCDRAGLEQHLAGGSAPALAPQAGRSGATAGPLGGHEGAPLPRAGGAGSGGLREAGPVGGGDQPGLRGVRASIQHRGLAQGAPAAAASGEPTAALPHGDRRGPGAAAAAGPGAGRTGVSDGLLRAWRLSNARYAGDLTGQGAARYVKRWNQSGQRAVYLGMTPEITVLEVLVHLNGVLSAPLVLCGYDVPDTPGLIAEADPIALPERSNAIPHGQASAAFGGDWLRAGEQLGLVLRSVVVP
jgi:RES domain-containing protein